MRKHLLGLMLLAGLTACTPDGETGRLEATVAGSEGGSRVPATSISQSSLAENRGSAKSFASLPDRGELLSYGGGRKVRESGAYSYHPVMISETHALNSVGGGDLVLQMPQGESLHLQYERHEEQPDGNWTWIGRDVDGSDAILTFGDKAVFGRVTVGERSYRILTDSAGGWVVATDSSRVPTGGGQRRAGPDFLVPPAERALAAAISSQLPTATTGSRVAEAAPAGLASKATGGFVDVVLGYSTGFSSSYGGQSAARTRLANLVAMTNAAYANSGVSMRLRAVHAVQVSLSDASDNKEVLHKLTGYNSDTQQPIPVDSAFSALRSARDEYGADVVAFVRSYREPEQDGCGIAWLLGMDQSGITVGADAGFAYAVVSDGTDRVEADGNTYFCSDYSLAHELGHLMGQAHNEESAADEGLHAYSFGYREASPTGFHTIMAYPAADTQFEIPHFANPLVNEAGRRTGVANEADNVKSMNIAMPIVASFRATVVPIEGLRPKHDVNADGRSDILWRQNQAGDQNFRIWLMNGNSRIRAIQYTMSPSYRIVATGDFNGDGRLDVIWRSGQSSQYRVWLGTSSGVATSWMSAFGAGWEIAGTGDVNGDGKDDILWRQNQSAPQNFRIWLMNGASRIRAYQYSMSTDYSLAGSGDLNGDGRLDLLWRAGESNQLRAWIGTGTAFNPSWISSLGSGWGIAGLGDVDGDGRADILWRSRSASSQNFSIWYMDGVQRKLSRTYNMALSYDLVTTGDFDGDGRTDLVWRSGNSRDYRFWMSTGSAFDASWVSAFGSGWSPVMPR